MQSLNRVILIGRLAAKPELKPAKNGGSFTRLRLATQRLRSQKDEESQGATIEANDKYITDWHSVFVWGTTAENCARYLNKGALVSIEGSLAYWETMEDDATVYKNAIRAEQVHFLGLGTPAAETGDGLENLDNLAPPHNHNAVAHPA